jgi:L-iditol 2-dehydrogenase/galactitol-1-phosphate 5-dehydrogenase
MKALVLEANGHLLCAEVPEPEKPTPDSILVQITHAGVCGSDLHRAFESGAYHYPLIMGHEMAGRVLEAADPAGPRSGEHVAIYPLLPCHRCGPCQTGNYAQCESYDYYGSRRNGGFSQRLWVPPENLFPVPAHVKPSHAAMTEPCAVALHGVRRLRTVAGEPAVVFGGGPIGNMTAQWLLNSGHRPVTVVEVDTQKLELAGGLGLQPLDAGQQDPVAEITKRGGAAVVVEAVGLPKTVTQAIRSARRGGQVLFLGNLSGQLCLGEEDFSGILRKELQILGTWNSSVTPRGQDDWTAVLNALDRDIQVESLITHLITLEDGPQILADMHARKGSFGKVIFQITD